ncbi:transcription termination/antitermination NusG family protein [Hyphomicrobium sp. B1]|uniref:transcription termination/antitermination NusG family protein n=1 Tax=Hyphomicrobium sp. B1 TaxID=3075651 RepID=UPI003C2BF1D1
MHLRNQGYEVYVPVLRKQIRHARQVREVLRPLFPGYLFARLTHSTMRWRPSAAAADENRNAPNPLSFADSRALRRPSSCDD